MKRSFLLTLSCLLFMNVCDAQQHKDLWSLARSYVWPDKKEAARQEFIKKTVSNKEFNTIYDLVKDKNYREQKACFLRGNCSTHPMDTLAREMEKNSISIKEIVKDIHKKQGREAFVQSKQKWLDSTKEEWRPKFEGWIQEFESLVGPRIEMLDEQESLLKRKLIFDDSVKEILHPEIKLYIKQLVDEHKLPGTIFFTAPVYDCYADPGLAATYEHPNVIGFKALVVGEMFFNSPLLNQKATIEHEINHLVHRDGVFTDTLSKVTGMRGKEIGRAPISHFKEYRSDQEPAAKNLKTAQIMENDWKFLAEEKPYNTMPSTHPHSLDRYKAVKTIRQLHEAQHRAKDGKSYPRFTPEQYEKYVVGYEKAWDNHCSQLKQEEIKRRSNQLFTSMDLF
ncbi:MAG TPA: hypothetical protein VHO47_02815 [Candidatus Babeliales bacterium]|nr:hypothetical protein [Candidatus Babeliales bacterium]